MADTPPLESSSEPAVISHPLAEEPINDSNCNAIANAAEIISSVDKGIIDACSPADAIHTKEASIKDGDVEELAVSAVIAETIANFGIEDSVPSQDNPEVEVKDDITAEGSEGVAPLPVVAEGSDDISPLPVVAEGSDGISPLTFVAEGSDGVAPLPVVAEGSDGVAPLPVDAINESISINGNSRVSYQRSLSSSSSSSSSSTSSLDFCCPCCGHTVCCCLCGCCRCLPPSCLSPITKCINGCTRHLIRFVVMIVKW